MGKPIFRIKSTDELVVDEGVHISSQLGGQELRRVNVLDENYMPTGQIRHVSPSDLQVEKEG